MKSLIYNIRPGGAKTQKGKKMPHETEKLDEKKIRRSWWYTPFTDSNGFEFMEPWGDDDYVSEVDTPEELIEFLKDWDNSDDFTYVDAYKWTVKYYDENDTLIDTVEFWEYAPEDEEDDDKDEEYDVYDIYDVYDEYDEYDDEYDDVYDDKDDDMVEDED